MHLEYEQHHVPSHRQTSTMEYQIKMSHREDRKETAQPIDVSLRQGSTEDRTNISHREDQKQREQGQVPHRQGSTTEDKIILSDREDRKQTAQRVVSEG